MPKEKTKYPTKAQKKDACILVVQRLLTSERRNRNPTVPYLNERGMTMAAEIAFESMEKMSIILYGNLSRLYNLPHYIIVERMLKQIVLCGPFYCIRRMAWTFMVNCDEIRTRMETRLAENANLLTQMLIEDKKSGDPYLPKISDEKMRALVKEMVCYKEKIRLTTNGTSVFEIRGELLIETITEQIKSFVFITSEHEEEKKELKKFLADTNKLFRRRRKSSFKGAFRRFLPSFLKS